MGRLVEELIEKIGEKNEFQRKILTEQSFSDGELDQLERFLEFNIRKRNKTLDDLVDAYLFVVDMAWEETYYFLEHGHYRNSTYEDVADSVYGNPEYMEQYMTGLSILDYLMISHLKMIRYFKENLRNWHGRYLEIGPGAGQLLVTAIERGDFQSFTSCDISETSVDLSNRYLEFLGWQEKCKVEKRDFFAFDSADPYDCIVMGEVLEHVEDPQAMLNKIYELLSIGGIAYVTTVINTPTLDHIYLFSDKEQVLKMAENVGFIVKDYLLATAGDISLDLAERKKRAINIAMILGKA